MSAISKMIHNLVSEIVDYPEEISIKEIRSTQHIIVELDVAPEDRAIVVGRNGVTINSLEQIVMAAAGKRKLKEKIYIQLMQ